MSISKSRVLTPIQLFIRGCRKRLFRLKVADSTGMRLTGGKLLAAALVMRRVLIREGVIAANREMIGVLLPPSVGAVLANVGIGISGKVAVNLNYSFTSDGVSQCLRRCDISHVLASRKFLKRRPFDLDAEIVCIEDLLEKVTWKDRIVCALQAYLFPAATLERRLGLDKTPSSDLMAVLFTSGTTGDPKGVMLSHRNIASSIDSIAKLFRVDQDDVVLGILPFFHAFGYSATLWLALALDMAAVYHFDPFGTKAIGRLASQHKVSLVFATPTFLRLYLRRCDPSQFPALDLAIVGAERLDTDLAAQFSEVFHATPVEGYGATELSPWASVNVPPQRVLSEGESQSKLGSVGKAVPDVEVKVVDPETYHELSVNQEGLLMVRGPNVMLGYLNDEEKTADVIHDDWYNTGDFATIDEEGFITITGRASRFSKIGGEMIPHEELENTIADIARDRGIDLQVAVTAIPDKAKGERLFVVHQPLGDLTADEITSKMAQAGLSNVKIPKPADFIEVDQLPTTSIGKTDLGALKQMAMNRVKT